MKRFGDERLTLPALLRERVERAPDRPFFATMDEVPLTIGDLEHRSRCIANGLHELGVISGHRVLAMLPNGVEMIETWFAVNRLGAVLVTINTAYRGAFFEHVVNDAASRILIVGHEFLNTVVASYDALPGIDCLIVCGERPCAIAPLPWTTIGFDELRGASEAAIDAVVEPSDLSLIIYTSGTTGRSKGVMIPHAQNYLNAWAYLDQLGVGSQDVFYAALPLFHTNALILQVYGAFVAGCPVHVARQFSASGWLTDIQRSGATVTNLLGVMTEFVFKQPPRKGDKDHALRIATAVPNTPALAQQFEARFGVRLIELYGSTEVNCPIYMPRGEPTREGSCGRALDEWFDCRIFDADTDIELPAGEVGELVVRPKIAFAFMAGYHGMPEETVSAWRNLWFHTGDAMRRDRDGYFYFVDRIKDCIRRRGENISSFEIERVVQQCAGVREVAAIGLPSDEGTEQEVMVYVVREPASDLSASMLHAFCAMRMPSFAVPRFIAFLDALPRTPTQKLRKQELRMRKLEADTWVAPDIRRIRAATPNLSVESSP